MNELHVSSHQLFQRQYQNVTQIITASFIVDATVGRNFVFRMDYTQRRYIQGFSLQSPDGTVYANLDYDDVAKVASLKIAEAEVFVMRSTLYDESMKQTCEKKTGRRMGIYIKSDQLDEGFCRRDRDRPEPIYFYRSDHDRMLCTRW